MAPKRSGVDPAAAGKSKKVSQQRSELALEAMASEVDVQRKAEQQKHVMTMMERSGKIADRCFAICTQEQHKLQTQYILHRNYVQISDIPCFRFEEPVRRSRIFKSHVFQQISQDKKLMGEVYKYLSGYHGNTAVGVVMMPVEHFTLVSTLQFESHGTLDCHRASFWASDIFCSNFDFGPFNFVKPLIDTVQDPLITEIIHRETNLTASLPHGLRLPTSQIGNDDGQFSLARWAFASTTLLKGPGALSLQVLKLYGKSDQRKTLRCERHYESMLVTPQMETIALTPPPEQPDMMLRLWQDKKSQKSTR